MKRTFLATFLSIIFAMVAVACHSSDEKEIGYAELPVQAQQFVKQYFPYCYLLPCREGEGQRKVGI